MAMTRHLIALVAALLQLTLPLTAYARAPFMPGAGDICSVKPAADQPRGNVPSDGHQTHCALCAHGAPPALPVPYCAQFALEHPAIEHAGFYAFDLPQPLHAHANARAPPVALTTPT